MWNKNKNITVKKDKAKVIKNCKKKRFKNPKKKSMSKKSQRIRKFSKVEHLILTYAPET